jgi:crotonobetainyl-CoA:carnitine CoA-transferase CaiB-like acyl-CoA transferase
MNVRAALEGIRILDFTQMMLGPWGTQFLGDLGADVIKVERPKYGEWERGLAAMGELLAGDSPFFMAMNRNKRSLTVNMKDPRGKEIIFRLLQTCDAVTENFRPGVLDKLGLGYEALRAVKPDIVYVAGSGYGPDGPYVEKPGQDLLIQSLSGLASQTGRKNDPPTPAGTSFVDASTALSLAFSVMVGLFHRERTGQGQRIDVSLFNTAIALQCQELTAFMNISKRWERSESGIGGAWLSAPFGIYKTSNGWMAISMNSLTVLGELLSMPQLAEFDTMERAYNERDVIKPMIEAKISTGTTEHWLELFATRDLWCAKVQNFDDLMTDPQVAHNELIQTIHHPKAGEVKVIGVPIRFSETPGTIRLAPPLVGEHNHQILSELGYGDAEIQRFEQEGVI